MMKAVYDLEHWQPSYCIVIFLMAAERERIRRGEDAMEIEIRPGTIGGFGPYKRWPNTPAACRQWNDGIVKPMCAMLPSAVRVSCRKERGEDDEEAFALPQKFNFRQYVEAYEEGIRPLFVPPRIPCDDKLVTITLRECGSVHWQARDSDVGQWCAAARSIEKAGYKVVIVRDTRFADAPLPGLRTSPYASTQLSGRMALYETAALNLFVNNGPAWFALALDVPVMMFRPACDTANRNSHTDTMASFGIRKGEQMIGAPDHQRLVWEEDRADVVAGEALKFLDEGRRP